MTKKYWHTWTLFKQTNWKYKWSYKFDFCQQCKTCNFKHKGRWLCTSCWDKERSKKANRKVVRFKAMWKHYYKTRILMYLEKKSHKPFWPKTHKTIEEKRLQKQEWYKNNSERISILRKAERRLKNWLPCLKLIINNKEVYLPFEDIDKPKNNLQEYDKWKEKVRQLELVRNFYM